MAREEPANESREGRAGSRTTPEVVGDVVRRLSESIAPRAVYLFGSYAYGQPHADSDVDLFIVVDRPELLTVEYLRRAHDCLSGTFLPIELHFRSLAKFERRRLISTSLEHDVATKGRLLYAA